MNKSYFKENLNLNISKLDEGIFFIVFENENQRVVRKVVKSKELKNNALKWTLLNYWKLQNNFHSNI